jgi:large subunit ribosomal protein L10
MAITKVQKKHLIDNYVQNLKDAKSIVIVKQNAISVSTATKVRKDVTAQDGKLNVVRKRLFLRAMKDAGLEEVGLETMDGSIFALYSNANEFGPLKVVNKYLKEFKSANKWAEFTFLGGWFEKKRQSADYVNELANVPTKEELLSKLCYLFKYPLQSFACVVNEIAKKDGTVESWKVESGKVEEVKVEKVEKAEEVPSKVIASESAAISEAKEEAPVAETVSDAPIAE